MEQGGASKEDATPIAAKEYVVVIQMLLNFFKDIMTDEKVITPGDFNRLRNKVITAQGFKDLEANLNDDKIRFNVPDEEQIAWGDSWNQLINILKQQAIKVYITGDSDNPVITNLVSLFCQLYDFSEEDLRGKKPRVFVLNENYKNGRVVSPVKYVYSNIKYLDNNAEVQPESFSPKQLNLCQFLMSINYNGPEFPTLQVVKSSSQSGAFIRWFVLLTGDGNVIQIYGNNDRGTWPIGESAYDKKIVGVVPSKLALKTVSPNVQNIPISPATLKCLLCFNSIAKVDLLQFLCDSSSHETHVSFSANKPVITTIEQKVWLRVLAWILPAKSAPDGLTWRQFLNRYLPSSPNLNIDLLPTPDSFLCYVSNALANYIVMQGVEKSICYQLGYYPLSNNGNLALLRRAMGIELSVATEIDAEQFSGVMAKLTDLRSKSVADLSKQYIPVILLYALDEVVNHIESAAASNDVVCPKLADAVCDEFASAKYDGIANEDVRRLAKVFYALQGFPVISEKLNINMQLIYDKIASFSAEHSKQLQKLYKYVVTRMNGGFDSRCYSTRKSHIARLRKFKRNLVGHTSNGGSKGTTYEHAELKTIKPALLLSMQTWLSEKIQELSAIGDRIEKQRSSRRAKISISDLVGKYNEIVANILEYVAMEAPEDLKPEQTVGKMMTVIQSFNRSLQDLKHDDASLLYARCLSCLATKPKFTQVVREAGKKVVFAVLNNKVCPGVNFSFATSDNGNKYYLNNGSSTKPLSVKVSI